MTTAATSLSVRPRDPAGSDEWPWVLVDDTGDVWGDYSSRVEAEAALHRATHCVSCEDELDRPDGPCVNPWCDRWRFATDFDRVTATPGTWPGGWWT